MIIDCFLYGLKSRSGYNDYSARSQGPRPTSFYCEAEILRIVSLIGV